MKANEKINCLNDTIRKTSFADSSLKKFAKDISECLTLHSDSKDSALLCFKATDSTDDCIEIGMIIKKNDLPAEYKALKRFSANEVSQQFMEAVLLDATSFLLRAAPSDCYSPQACETLVDEYSTSVNIVDTAVPKRI